jgi:putative tricarboxylic transport membrane protein
MMKSDLVPIVFWIVLSLFFMSFSLILGLGGFHNPGPGLFPFLVSACLFLVVLYLLLSHLKTRVILRRPESMLFGQRYAADVCFVLAALLGYALALESVGYIITSALLLGLLFGLKNRTRWKLIIILSVLTTLVSYFGFVALGVRFPAGILRLG